MTEFPIVQINGYANVQSGYSFKSSDWLDDGVPVVKIANVKDGRVDRTGLGFVSETVAAQAAKFSLSEGDVLLAMTGYVGEMAVVKESDLPLLLNQRVGRCLPVSPLLDKRFMYYALSSSNGRLQLENLGQGSAQANLSAGDFGLVEIPLPPLAEQRAIAGVLGAIDDKIESNRRLAATIDGLLRAELENAILNDDNPREVRFGEIALRVGEASDPRNLREHVPYIGLEHMPRGSMFLDEWGTSEGLGSGKSVFKEGNVLFGRLRPYFKKVGVAPIDGICSTDVLVLKPAFNESAAMLLALAASEEFIGYASAAATGTKMPRVSWGYLSDWKTVVPSEATTNRFDNEMLPLVAKAVASVHERVALAKLRDALLPELLSGRLRVKDAESMMENV